MATIQEHACQASRSSLKLLLAAVKAMPADKVGWAPMGKARSAFTMMQEVGSFPDWIMYAIREGKTPDHDPSVYEEFVKQNNTLDKAIATAEA